MEVLSKPLNILRSGGIVIFPTDTAFGIGCRIDNEKAVKKLFVLRRRPETQATPVLVDSIEMAEKYLVTPLPDNVRRLMKKYWPGGLTIIYPCKTERVPRLVRGNGQNLGIRMPNNPTVLKLIKGIGVPILGPSANFHGLATPYRYEDIDKNLLKLADYVIEGKCRLGVVSTVADCSVIPWRIIRHGAVKIEKDRNYTLYIDTTDNHKICLSLYSEKKKYELNKPISTWASQELLPLIDKILSKHGVSLYQLNRIEVRTGEGSFTGIRVGLSVAQTLGLLLEIPVV